MDLSQSDVSDLGEGQSSIYGSPLCTPARQNTYSAKANRLPVPPDTPCNVGHVNIRSILQEQQGILQQILSKQDAIERRQIQFEARVCQLEASQSSLATTPSSRDGTGKRKCTVSRRLSANILNTHYTLEDLFHQRKLNI